MLSAYNIFYRYRKFSSWLFAVSFLALAACSSGGGGGDREATGTFSLQTNQVSFSGQLGQNTPDAQEVRGTLTNPDGNVFIMVDASATPLIQNADVNINGNSGTLLLWPADGGNIGVGTFTGNVTVKACRNAQCTSQYLGSPQTIRVTYTITSPEVTLSAAQLQFNGVYEGASLPAPQSFNLTADFLGIPTFGFTYAIPTPTWVQVTQDSFGMTGFAEFTVSITEALPPGTYETHLYPFLFGPAVAKDILITYVVEASPFTVETDNLDFQLDASATTPQAIRTVTIGGIEGATAIAWTAEVDVPWLSLSQATGSTATPAPVELSVNAAEAVYLLSGQHSATLRLFATDEPSKQRLIDINLDLTAPRVTTVAPYLGFADQAATVSVKGYGFTGLPTDAIKVGDTAPTTVEIVSDNILRVSLPAMPAGRYPVRITTSELDLSDSDYVVVAASTPQAAEIITGLNLRHMLYDDERKAIYALGPDRNNPSEVPAANGNILIFTLTETGWEASELEVADGYLDGLAMTPDGKYLTVLEIVESATPEFHLVDIATQTLTRSFAATGLSDGLTQTLFYNNRQAVMHSSSRLYYFDVRSGVIHPDVTPDSFNTNTCAISSTQGLEFITSVCLYGTPSEWGTGVPNVAFRNITFETALSAISSNLGNSVVVGGRDFYQLDTSPDALAEIDNAVAVSPAGDFILAVDFEATEFVKYEVDSLTAGQFGAQKTQSIPVDLSQYFFRLMNAEWNTAVFSNSNALYIVPVE